MGGETLSVRPFTRLDSWWVNVKRFRHDSIGVLGVVLLTISLSTSLLAPVFTSHNPYTHNLKAKLSAPSAEHVFGTDEVGRDVFARLLYGGRFTISVSFFAVVFALLAGIPLGLLSGYAGKLIDDVLMRIADLILSIPYFLYAIVIVSVLGPSLLNCMLAIAIRLVGSYLRLIRGLTLEVRDLDYIRAASVSGFGHLRITLRHILPNISAPIIVLSTLNVADSIIMTSALGFIGLGAQPPSPEWGAMLSSARFYMFAGPHLIIATGITIVVAVLGFNLVGDSLRDRLDPSLRAYLK